MKRIYHRFQRIFFYYTQFFSRRIIYINNSFSKQLALTFDDGPDPFLTRQILEILKEYNISATFFLSGTAIEKAPEIVGEIFNGGHCLGNHGYKHVSPEEMSADEIISGFEKTDRLIKEHSGPAKINFSRPPYGKATKEYQSWITEKNKYIVQWSLDSYDYRNDYNADQIFELLLKDVRNGDILLFHDTKPFTKDVLRMILPELLLRSYRFVRLDEKFK
jgi:peptidoglycan-N-acetylglucosamine deacetylase